MISRDRKAQLQESLFESREHHGSSEKWLEWEDGPDKQVQFLGNGTGGGLLRLLLHCLARLICDTGPASFRDYRHRTTMPSLDIIESAVPDQVNRIPTTQHSVSSVDLPATGPSETFTSSTSIAGESLRDLCGRTYRGANDRSRSL
jgi:hypothetical protein